MTKKLSLYILQQKCYNIIKYAEKERNIIFMKFKICVIGCGDVAIDNHGHTYLRYKNENPDAVLAGCCDLSIEKAEYFSGNFGFLRAYTDLYKMLDIEKPDAVCLLSPVKATCKLSIEVIKLGYPLILEKPPGLSPSETMEIIKAAEERNAKVRVAFNRRYAPLVISLKNELADQRVLSVTNTFVRHERDDPDFSTTAIHGIDTIRHLADSDYKEAFIEYQKLDSGIYNFYIYCKFNSGAVGQIILRPTGGVQLERYMVGTENATYFLDMPIWDSIDKPGKILKTEDGHISKIITGDSLVKNDIPSENLGFYNENAMFFDDIKSNAEFSINDLKASLQTVAITEALRNRKTSVVF